MHNDELESILIGKTITTVKFTAGVSGHCNFIKEIHLDDGTICCFDWTFRSDFLANCYRKVTTMEKGHIWPVLRIKQKDAQGRLLE